jgi:hypothetical protein
MKTKWFDEKRDEQALRLIPVIPVLAALLGLLTG